MAKTTCKNCGHKNPSSAAVCTKCGSFLFDEPVQTPSQTTQVAPAQNTDEPEVIETEATPYQGRIDTIKVAAGNSTQWISMIVGFALFAVFLVLSYTITLPSYSIYIFLVMIFVLPSLMRRSSMGVKFTPGGFSFPKTGNEEFFQFSSIDSVRIGMYDRSQQTLTLNFKDEHVPVKVDFRSIMVFRSFITALSRRRITIVPYGQQNTGTASAAQ